MEEVIAIAIGILAASGVWLILRPRTFQVVMGLCLLSYAVNLFIFSMGRLTVGAPAIMPRGGFVNPDAYADPIPQALVLTAIVISFGVTALLLALAYRSWMLTEDDEVADDVGDRTLGRDGTVDREVVDASDMARPPSTPIPPGGRRP